MYQVYILKSLQSSWTYVGYSEDAKFRLTEHNSGKVEATRNRRPLQIIFVEKLETLAEAKKRELYWKSGGGRRKLKKYFDTGFPKLEIWAAIPPFGSPPTKQFKCGRGSPHKVRRQQINEIWSLK